MGKQPEVLFLEGREVGDSLLPVLSNLAVEVTGPFHELRDALKRARQSDPALVVAHFNGRTRHDCLSTLGKVQKLTSAPLILIASQAVSAEAEGECARDLRLMRRFVPPVCPDELLASARDGLQLHQTRIEDSRLRVENEQLFRNSPHAVVLTDTAGRVVRANEAALHLWKSHSTSDPTGLDAAERFPLRDIVGAGRIRNWVEAFAENAAQGAHGLSLLEAGEDTAAIRLRVYPRPLLNTRGAVEKHLFHLAIDALDASDDTNIMQIGRAHV